MEEKTNVMRILEQKKIAYQPHSYVTTDAVSGTEVAAVLGQDPKRVFKTLVTVAKSGNHYVFVIPVEKELDLKKAASVSSLPPFFKGYFVGLPNRYTFFYRQEHRVFFCHVECLIPSTDLRQCTVYAPFAQ